MLTRYTDTDCINLDCRYHAPPTAPGQLPAAPAVEQQQQQSGGKGAQAAVTTGAGQQQEGAGQPVAVVVPPVGVGAAVPVAAQGALSEEEAGAQRRG